jgi:DNA-binding GntR family transcriptional regulator
MSGDDLSVPGPAPLRPNSLREQIRETLCRQILHGEIGAEDRLVDVDIAGRLGVSRMPVREALLQLVNEGYLVGTTRGFMIPRLTSQDIRDIFEVRKLLEPRAAFNAARHLTAAGAVAIQKAAARSRRAFEAGDVDEFVLANMQFRRAWLSAEPNWRLAATIQRFVDQVQTVRLGTLHDPTTRDIAIDGIDRLATAFERRDAAKAEILMAEFIGHAEARFFAVRGKEMAEREAQDETKRAT